MEGVEGLAELALRVQTAHKSGSGVENLAVALAALVEVLVVVLMT